MSKFDEAVEVVRLSKEVKNCAGFTAIPESGFIHKLDDGSSQGDRFVGFVIKGELISEDAVKMKLEEFLSEALMYVAGTVMERVQVQANTWAKHFKNLAVSEAKTVLKDYED
jgi:hypothetical protein